MIFKFDLFVFLDKNVDRSDLVACKQVTKYHALLGIVRLFVNRDHSFRFIIGWMDRGFVVFGVIRIDYRCTKYASLHNR